MQNPKANCLGLVFNNQSMDSHVSHMQARPSTRVGFFDSACQWRFATYRNSIGGGKHMSYQKPRRKDKLISRSQRIAFGVDFVEQDARQKSAPTEALPRVGDGFMS